MGNVFHYYGYNGNTVLNRSMVYKKQNEFELDYPSLKLLGRLSLFSSAGSGAPGFDIKPLGVGGLNGGFG